MFLITPIIYTATHQGLTTPEYFCHLCPIFITCDNYHHFITSEKITCTTALNSCI